MRARDLDLRELMDFEPQGGIIRFAGDRAVLLNTVALGVLRQELIDTVGVTTARGILTRFGYAHGWRTAETLKSTFDWESPHEWRLAGGRLHQLQGFLTYEPATREPGEQPRHFADSIWRDSYEAQEHLLHIGQSTEPVCWTLCGFASGYLSYCEGKRIYCVEQKCRAKGDAHCLMVGDTEEAWGDAMKDQLAFYGRECLDDSLRHVTDLLKMTERQLAARRRELARVDVREPKTGIVAHSEKMKAVLDQVHRVSHVDTTVLLTGESGVGKEVLAHVIHDDSARSAMPFLAMNCAAVPEALIESELFGHVRGAFTGATQDRIGLFEAATRGTLLLDEVGDLPAAMQVKLLRVLQEREIRRVGENRSRRVDVRVLAATHRDLNAEVAAGRFRQDLLYRLRVIEITIPPLRERSDDILPMARRFVAEIAGRLGLPITGLAPRAADQLARWSWPGNIRELQNVIERAIVLAHGKRIELEDLPEEIRRLESAVAREQRSLADVEREHIHRILESVGGNRTKAAAILEIGPATLFRKLKTFSP